MIRFLSARLLIPLVLAGMAVGFLVVGGDGGDKKKLTAHFTSAISVYVGTDVRVLGVNVGEVTAVTPEGDSVRVDMEYDEAISLPADARAAIVTPTLVADRFVQITPAYTEGEILADAAILPLEEDGQLRNGVPVELDRIYGALQDLTQSLGPNGVNADGTLNHLVEASATALKGQGKRANLMLRRLADAAETFGDSRGDLFATVEYLAQFTTTLAQNDQLVRAFMEDLADVSQTLSGERDELALLLSSLADTVGTVESFVKNNRQALVTDVRKLSRVLKTINSERESLLTALKVAPVAMNNLILAYNTESGTIGSRIGISGNIWDADGLICSIVMQTALPRALKNVACQLVSAVLEPVLGNLPPIPPGPPGRQQATSKTQVGEIEVPTSPRPRGFTAPGAVSLKQLLGGGR